MEASMKITRFALWSIMAIVLLSTSGWVAAEGPAVASFPEWIQFASYESPEGVAVDKVGNVYVSVLIGLDPPYDEIWKFSPTGEKTVLTQFPDAGRVGLAVDAMGNVYIARNGPSAGVYVVDQDGYAALLPGTEEINYADGLAFDERGNLYITDFSSYATGPGGSAGCTNPLWGLSGIYRFPKKGTEAEPWLYHELLTGICPEQNPFSLGMPGGANGIQFYKGNLYVINQDQRTIVQVPILPDGSPGEPAVWATLTIQPEPDSPFASLGWPAIPDGFAFDVHGNAYVAIVSHSAIVRIDAKDKSQETIAALLLDPDNPKFAPFDVPPSVAFGTGKGGQTNIFVTNLGWLVPVFGFPSAPGPGLIKLDVGAPGLPLP
jgi:sugar lactone lactonase YvrE